LATFCLIHGAWHEPSCWVDLIPELVKRGHEAVAPELPLHDPGAGYDQRVEPALLSLDSVDDPVVIVGHSQGTAYSTLVAAARPGAMLVHLCPRLGGFESPPGAPDTFRDGVPFPETRPDGTSAWEADAAIAAMYRRLPADRARSLAGKLRPMAMTPGEYPLRAHPDNPTALFYATEDELFNPAWQRFMALEFLHVEPLELPTGHFPMVEDPDGLATLLDGEARGGARE